MFWMGFINKSDHIAPLEKDSLQPSSFGKALSILTLLLAKFRLKPDAVSPIFKNVLKPIPTNSYFFKSGLVSNGEA